MTVLRSDMQKDMENLITSLQDSINMLVDINKKWETSLKECNDLKQQNLELNMRMIKMEKENELLNNQVRQLEDKLKTLSSKASQIAFGSCLRPQRRKCYQQSPILSVEKHMKVKWTRLAKYQSKIFPV